jgi:hypothetical protein
MEHTPDNPLFFMPTAKTRVKHMSMKLIKPQQSHLFIAEPLKRNSKESWSSIINTSRSIQPEQRPPPSPKAIRKASVFQGRRKNTLHSLLKSTILQTSNVSSVNPPKASFASHRRFSSLLSADILKLRN